MKKIIFGSLLVLSIVLLMPVVPAVECDVATETLERRIFEKTESIEYSQFKEKVKSLFNDVGSSRIKVFLLTIAVMTYYIVAIVYFLTR